MTDEDETVENNESSENQIKKKHRKFHPKEFRQQLITKDAYNAIKNFIELCSEENATQDYALEYLESGGSCSEILRVFELSENKNASYVLPVIEALTIILLKIISSHPQKQKNGEDSCKELLTKHYSAIKSMFSLNSTNKQRKIVLKLLSTMVTLSPNLAKEVLAHVYFDDSLLQVFTTTNADSVRSHFIHFLISFFIEGHAPTILTLLQKKNILESIFPGLIYDSPEIIHLVLSTLQMKFLKESEISKTVKINLFSSKIVQHLINLYNWRGPNKSKAKNVDPEEKQEVCEIAHQFLIVLCASRHGVIFQDPLIGMGKKNCNPLLSKVLKSLHKPWNNEFASELIQKICIVCPDLLKDVFADVVASFETRTSKNWLYAVNFIKNLLENIDPEYLAQFLPNLTSKQISNLIQTIYLPQPILKSISTEILLHDHIGVRHEGILLLYSMLNATEKFLLIFNNSSNCLNENKSLVINFVEDYLQKQLPSVTVIATILKDCRNKLSENENISDKIPIPEISTHLSAIIGVLCKYKSVCPQLTEHITKEIDVLHLLKTSECVSSETNELQVKIIDLMISCDPFIFHPSNDLFSYVLPLLLKWFFESHDCKNKIESVLVSLFNVTGIFEGCNDEIFIWLYSILEQKTYDENFGEFMVSVLQNTCENFVQFNNELISFKDHYSSANILNINESIRHKILSPLIIEFLNCSVNGAKFEIYTNIVLLNLLFFQTNHNLLASILIQDKYKTIINKYLIKYCKNIDDISALNVKLFKFSDNFTLLYKFLTNDEVEINYANWPNYFHVLSINFVIYFYTHYVTQQKLERHIQEKCLGIIFDIINKCDGKSLQNCLNTILRHPVLLKTFCPTHDTTETTESLCTEFVLKIIEEAFKKKTKDEMEIYLKYYRFVICDRIFRLLKNKIESKTPKLIDSLKLIDLTYKQLIKLFEFLFRMKIDACKNENYFLIVGKLINFILNHELILKSLETFIPQKLFNRFAIKVQDIYESNSMFNFEDFENSFHIYISKFPFTILSFNKLYFTNLIVKSSTNKSSIKLAIILLKYNKNFYPIFTEKLNEILEKREMVLGLLNVLDEKEFEKTSLKIYQQYEQVILKFLNKPQKIPNYLIEYYPVVIKLINRHMSTEICKNIAGKSHKFDVTEYHHFKVMSAVFEKSILLDDSSQYLTNYIVTVMNLVINTLKRIENDENQWIKIENIVNDLFVFIVKTKNVYKINNFDLNLYKTNTFENFAKLCLKFGLNGKFILINILKQICTMADESVEMFDTIFDMALMHSESLNILLSNNEIKGPLLGLLLLLCQKCPSVVKKEHIPIWLGAYGATLSQSDQYLLHLLTIYEEANIGFHEFRPYVWGSLAVNYYSVNSGEVKGLWRQPRPKDILEIFIEKQINKTIVNFPRTRELKPTNQLYSDGDLDVYDPSFYLPLLSHLLLPESPIKWYQISNKGILNLVLICLSSNSTSIRSAAYHVLSRFYHHLESATYAKQRLLWLHFVESICKGMSKMETSKLSSIVAVFLCRCSTILTLPDNKLYKTLGNFIIAKESPNFSKIPELLEMLHSDDVNHNIQRIFILTVIRDGISTRSDLKVMFHSLVFKFIMDIFNSTIANDTCKELILEILSAAVIVPEGSQCLTSSYSLIPWLHGITKDLTSKNSHFLSILIDIIHNLVNSFKKTDIQHYQFKLLFLLVTIIDLLKDIQVNITDLVKYLKVFYILYNKKPHVLNKQQLCDLIDVCSKYFDCYTSNYYLKFGINYIGRPVLESEENKSQASYYLNLLTWKFLEIQVEK